MPRCGHTQRGGGSRSEISLSPREAKRRDFSNDLVFGISEYERAYNQATGRARMVLTSLLEYTVVFLGASLGDPYTLQLLDQIERLLISEKTLGGRSAQRLADQPPWFAILSDKTDDLLGALASYIQPHQVEQAKIARALEWSASHPLKVIWYWHDDRHLSLREILKQFRAAKVDVASTRFLEMAEEIEELAKLTTPESSDIARVFLLLRHSPNRRLFFRYAVPSWLPSSTQMATFSCSRACTRRQRFLLRRQFGTQATSSYAPHVSTPISLWRLSIPLIRKTGK